MSSTTQAGSYAAQVVLLTKLKKSLEDFQNSTVNNLGNYGRVVDYLGQAIVAGEFTRNLTTDFAATKKNIDEFVNSLSANDLAHIEAELERIRPLA
jgi:hypothetical protein